jgi:hypothetical protein
MEVPILISEVNTASAQAKFQRGWRDIDESTVNFLIGAPPHLCWYRINFSSAILPFGGAEGNAKAGGDMVVLFFELYGAVCFFSLVAFLILAAMAKLRPDLDEEEFDFVELEKLKKLVSSEGSGDALPVDAPVIQDAPKPAPARPVKQSKRPARVRPHLLPGRKPRTI